MLAVSLLLLKGSPNPCCVQIPGPQGGSHATRSRHSFWSNVNKGVRVVVCPLLTTEQRKPLTTAEPFEFTKRLLFWDALNI